MKLTGASGGWILHTCWDQLNDRFGSTGCSTRRGRDQTPPQQAALPGPNVKVSPANLRRENKVHDYEKVDSRSFEPQAHLEPREPEGQAGYVRVAQ